MIIRSKDKEGQLIERFSCLYSNCAFMGIPLIQGVYGTEGVFCLTAYVTMFNLCSWTHGVVMMKGGKPNFKQMLKSLLSPSIIVTIIGIIPVSYTHLDVYKRQFVNEALSCLIIVPTTVLCLLPMKDKMKYSIKNVLPLFLGVLVMVTVIVSGATALLPVDPKVVFRCV